MRRKLSTDGTNDEINYYFSKGEIVDRDRLFRIMSDLDNEENFEKQLLPREYGDCFDKFSDDFLCKKNINITIKITEDNKK